MDLFAGGLGGAASLRRLHNLYLITMNKIHLLLLIFLHLIQHSVQLLRRLYQDLHLFFVDFVENIVIEVGLIAHLMVVLPFSLLASVSIG